jgi:hypothetical protein
MKFARSKVALATSVFLLNSFFLACNSPSGSSETATDQSNSILPDTAQVDPPNPPINPLPTPSSSPTSTPTAGPGEPTIEIPKPEEHAFATDVLLFNGTGVSTSDWQTTEEIVKDHGWSYKLVNSAQLNAMSLDEISNFGVIIVPGGSGGTITSALTTSTRLRVRQAVRDRGVSYVGFCAGAWVAVGPEAETTGVASYGLALAKGAVLDLYLPGGIEPTAAMVDVTFSDGKARDLVWWGGPSTPEWKNGVVARYENGEPAISETWAGKGYVVISGPHPEAPQSWRGTAGYDSDGLDYDIAIQMITAALKKAPMPTY